MSSYLPFIVIALAVSLDGCSVGLLYGTRNIRIPFVSLLIISICSGIVIWCSMKAGIYFSQWLEPETAKAAGALILVLIGLWAIVQFFMNRRVSGTSIDETVKMNSAAQSPLRTVLRIEIRKIGLVIQILRSPSIADIDKSGNISPWEASLLGLALSLDALGAGIGAALVGYSALPTAVWIALSSGCFIAIGLIAGRWATRVRWLRKMTVLPGLLLIAIGIMKLM